MSTKTLCGICGESAAKYKCPGCLVHTCSLPCVKQHKNTSGCSGQRDKTAFVAMKEFTDLNLLSDYRLLEDTHRKKYSASTDMKRKSHNIPSFLRDLLKQAKQRKINLQIMPYPMSRRKDNHTTYNWKQRSILWQIEWIFPQAESKIIDKRKSETSTLDTLLAALLGSDGDPVVRHKLKPYTETDSSDLGLFMKVENTEASEMRYHCLDISKSLTDNLANKTVIEFPTIYVVLRKHWHEYPTLVNAEQSRSDVQEDVPICSPT